MLRSFITILLYCSIHLIFGQAQVTSDFEILNERICIGNQLILDNRSVNADSYQWDFCFEELDQVPILGGSYSMVSASFTSDIDVVQDSGQWYGFVTDYLLNRVSRLSYGSSLENVPVETSLGNLGNFLRTPNQTKLYQDSLGVWYGFTLSTGNSRMVRSRFGNGLNAAPTSITNLGGFSNLITPNGLSLVVEEDAYIMAVSNRASGVVSLINFGSSLLNNPTVDDVIALDTDMFLFDPEKISIIESNGSWYGLISSWLDNKVYRLSFGTTLFDLDFDYDLVSTAPAVNGVELIKNGSQYYGLLASENAGFYRLSFGTDLNSTPGVATLGKLGTADELRTLKLVRFTPDWYGFTTSRNGGIISRLDFLDECTGLLSTTNAFEPSDISYETSGDYVVELTANHANGRKEVTINSLTVLDRQAPDISFRTSNQCVSSSNTFIVDNVSGDITSYLWDFGDGLGTLSMANPTYQYSNAGSYNASLTVSNGSCENVYSRVVNIYNAPVASFMKPSSNICSNTPLSFTNTSTYDAGSPVCFSWDFDGDNVEDSASENPSFTYTSAGTYTISLAVHLANGCTDIFTDEITLQEGPAVSFDWEDNCFGQAVQLTNRTVDNPNYSFRWNFGDGSEESMERNPIHTFGSVGSYQVRLTMNDGNCNIELTQTLEISDTPLASILASTAVENVAVNFTGQDETLQDDQIATWLWDFGGVGTATTQEAIYTFSKPGDYTITLDVTTTQGCSSRLTTEISVLVATRPSSIFVTSDTICRGETLLLNNRSANAERFIWDFCFTELDSVPIAGDAYNMLSSSFTSDIELVQDSGVWFGFVTDFLLGKVTRLTYGSSLENVPAETDLGNLGNFLSSPYQTRFYRDSDGLWCGFTLSSGNSRLVRTRFGNGLNAAPTSITNLGGFSSLSTPYGLSVIEEKGTYIMVVSNRTSGLISMISFGSNLSNNPTAADVITIGADLGLRSPDKLAIIESNDVWYGLISSVQDSKVYRLDLGTTLFDSNYTFDLVSTASSVYGVEL
ncbi:MAG: PKD repeat protein, partial [Parvicella sp.]